MRVGYLRFELSYSSSLPVKVGMVFIFLVMYYLRRKKKDKPLFDKAGVKVTKRTDYVKKLDRVFSEYIRLRDAMGGYFRCISCGKIKPYAQADCGHYFSRTKMSTRFDEDNCNAECRSCNRFSADHLDGYRKNLIAKIGQQRFDLLSFKASQVKKWTDFELKSLIDCYTEKVKQLRKEKGL